MSLLFFNDLGMLRPKYVKKMEHFKKKSNAYYWDELLILKKSGYGYFLSRICHKIRTFIGLF